MDLTRKAYFAFCMAWLKCFAQLWHGLAKVPVTAPLLLPATGGFGEVGTAATATTTREEFKPQCPVFGQGCCSAASWMQ